MKKDDWRQLRDFAGKYDLELINVSGVRNLVDVVIAEMAIKEIDQALIRTGDALGTTMELNRNIRVTARRRIKKTASTRYRN